MKAINEALKDCKFNLDIKLKILERNESEVYKNWYENALITKEDFKETLIWLCNDPLTKLGYLSRELGLEITKDMDEYQIIKLQGLEPLEHKDWYDENNLKGKIVKLERIYGEPYEIEGKVYEKFLGFYDNEAGRQWFGTGRHKVGINARSSI